MGDQRNDEEEQPEEQLGALDHIFSALKNFARASDSRSAAPRAGKTATGGAFGTPVKKSCCLARRGNGTGTSK